MEPVDYDLGPERRAVVPHLRVLVVEPGPRSDSWAYVTAGCWASMEKQGRGLEFVMTAHVRDQRFIELMAMIAYYHCGGHQLDLEHSMPIGEPWVPGSTCAHLLISLPYLHGPDLEHCPLPRGHARILWTLPVTTAEIEFRQRHGHEALERLFDEAEIIPTDPFRASVA
ncbi:suppressor of fused domain protein [Streptomyces sp. NPDC006872]|uniref:suppressor of fused domain protein n=1 Tax=Streptomyces sp. NPDC006872 TaxID=3155720 RepID=UPI0033C7E487